MDKETICLCALNRIYGFEPKTGLHLLDTFGSASALFEAEARDLRAAMGPYADRSGQFGADAFDAAAMELETLAQSGCVFIGIRSPGYPELLLECGDPPIGLYFKGFSSPETVFGSRPAIAVIGTRDISSYGREWCARIVDALARSTAKPLIVSGLALGTDILAQVSALEAGLPTVSVMATGIDAIYPARHKDIAIQIAETEGCALVTDYPPQTEPLRYNFLRRNRIIAGICRATVLIESNIKGGGMMTARLAASYDRDVFALPGRIDDPKSQGCNLLIRENIAQQIGDLGEFLDKLGFGNPGIRTKADFRAAVENQYREQFPDESLREIVAVAMAVKRHRGLTLDDLSAMLKWPYGKVARYTGLLECDGFISVDLLQKCCANVGKTY